MPAVDFTKAELIKDLSGLIHSEIVLSEGRLRDDMTESEGRLRGEITDLRGEMTESVECLRGEMREFERRLRAEMAKFEDRITFSANAAFQEVGDQLAEIKSELRGVRRVVRQHSADIADMRAAQNL